MRLKDAVFAALAVLLVAGWAVAAARAWPAIVPPPRPTLAPAPSRPLGAPRLPGRIAFVQRGDVYLISDGRSVPLTSGGGHRDPALSDDGGRIAYSLVESIEGRSDFEGQVVPGHFSYESLIARGTATGAEDVMVDGLQRRDPSGFHRVEFELQPAWSPDGTQLAFISDDGDGADLEVLTVATRRFTVLSRGSVLADPAWAPDGKTIAVTTYTNGTPGVLFVPVNGRGTPQRLRLAVEGDPYRPAYSPDGRWLLVTLRTGRGNDLVAVELETEEVVDITQDGRSWGGVFSPDGERIAFLREEGGAIHLYALDLGELLRGGAAKGAQRLAQGVDGASRPSWSR